jgi:poly(beta-D-mannuronate) lyase
MHKLLPILGLAFLLIACEHFTGSSGLLVNNNEELQAAIKNAEPGDEIVLSDGVWKDVQIHFTGKGTNSSPIVLRAQTSGQVFIEGRSYIKMGGEYLIVDGLYFKNGHTPSNAIIEFKLDENNIANHCTVKNCGIEDFVQPNRYYTDRWVEFWGRYNRLEHCYIAGKFNKGPTVRINLEGNESIRNHHRITNNHFGPRPRKGGPSAETIQIGNSFTSMAPSYANVSNNLFERCNGEVEVISSKTNFNEFKNNIFFECEGSLVFRHGNYCLADGNIFIGDRNSQFNGGIRVINTGHWITNNYFYMVKGDEFRSALAVMNGIPRSPLNRYNQVTDVVVAYNSWIDCSSPWQFSVGANMNKRDVLPEREIRSARPLRTILANNIIYNNQVDGHPIKTYDKVDGILFRNNIFDNQNIDFASYEGIETKSIQMEKVNDWLYVPAEQNDVLNATYSGFGFEDIDQDLFGHSRQDQNRIGAISRFIPTQNYKIDKSRYGPEWFPVEKTEESPRVNIVSATADNLTDKIARANDGDTLELTSGPFEINESLAIHEKLTIRSKDLDDTVKITFTAVEEGPLFQMRPRGNLRLENIILQGNKDQIAIATLKKNMSFGYNLWLENVQIKGFKSIIKAYKGSFADTISLSNSVFESCLNGIELDAETEDRGDYNAEFVYVRNCRFIQIQKNIINFYRGGYDESTIGGNLAVKNSLFKNCGRQEQSKILLKTRGIINVDISNNRFHNNSVKLVALLWGEKNNRHGENKLINSGTIRVDKYLKQKLVY